MILGAFLGGYEALIIILILGIPILLIILVIRKFRQWDDSLKEISANQKLILEKMDERKDKKSRIGSMKNLLALFLFISMLSSIECISQEAHFRVEKHNRIYTLLPLSDSLSFSDDDQLGIVNWNLDTFIYMLENAVVKALSPQKLEVLGAIGEWYYY